MKKKVKLAGKFGARYGRGVKKKIIMIEQSAHAAYPCPKCNRNAVRRVAAGIWQCGKCNAKIAGGAYSLTTSSTEMMEKIFARKKEQ
ncbi:MAG: 50S ribosomal protein L37ae [Candidatus Nanohalarchaeota archaeon]|nr:MAG: 50S ribosomal protein L37ae [Candidatus Nanohaloarchaeota archaeon]